MYQSTDVRTEPQEDWTTTGLHKNNGGKQQHPQTDDAASSAVEKERATAWLKLETLWKKNPHHQTCKANHPNSLAEGLHKQI